MTRPRYGLTLVEMLAVMAILAALAAVLYPAVAVQIRKGQASALADQLQNLSEAIRNYRANVLRYPHQITYLTTLPLPASSDICIVPTPAANLARWRGPYMAQNIIGALPVGDATIQPVVQRNPANNAGGPFGMLQLVVTDVDSTTAADLEAQFDGNANYGTGTILWVPVGGVPRGTLTYQMPIRDC